MPKLATDDARALARSYYDLAVTLGQYRFDNWSAMTQPQRAQLESLEWSLLTQSSDMTTRAISMTVDDLSASLRGIARATKDMTRAIKRIADVKKVIVVAAKALDLGAAIFTGNATAIAKGVSGALAAAGVD